MMERNHMIIRFIDIARLNDRALAFCNRYKLVHHNDVDAYFFLTLTKRLYEASRPLDGYDRKQRVHIFEMWRRVVANYFREPALIRIKYLMDWTKYIRPQIKNLF